MTDKDKTTVPIRAFEKDVTHATAHADPLVGTRIADRYELLEPPMRGGFGRVYKARDTKLDRIVAIKLVDLGAMSEDTRLRMLREARTNARLHHTNVVVLHDAGEDPWGLYLVLEYVAGTSLAQALENGPLEPHRASEIVRDCAAALAAAHAHGIVHRDIKPGNILLTENGRVKVADFGVARMIGEARLTDRETIIGTPNYMAPEQIDGKPVGPAADMFALGCVFYEILAGRPPFDGETTSEVLGRILRGSPDAMPPLDRSVSPLVDAIASLLDKNPDRRLKPNELIQRLRSWERREGVVSVRDGRRLEGAIIGTTAIVAAIVGASLVLRNRPAPPPPPPSPSILVRVADTPAAPGPIITETLQFSSRDALFAYVEFVGRNGSEFLRIDNRTISIEGTTESVRMRTEEARVIDQLLGHDVFREPSLLTSNQPSTRLLNCDFAAIHPSELVALLSAAASWPVVQSADAPLESSALLRVAAENRPWDEVLLNVLRAAGLTAHRYETIWLVTAEDVVVIPRLKVLAVFPPRYSTEEVRQRAAGSVSKDGIVWTVEAGGTDGVIIVDSAGGIDAVFAALSGLQGPDWKVVSPRRFTGQPISLRLDGAPLKDVLDFYGNLTKRPHVAEVGTAAYFRANIVEIPADEFLWALLDANGLTTIESDGQVIVKPFATEVIDVRVANATLSVFDPLRTLADRASELTGVTTTIEGRGDSIRIEGRSDIVRDLADVVRTIDLAMGR